MSKLLINLKPPTSLLGNVVFIFLVGTAFFTGSHLVEAVSFEGFVPRSAAVANPWQSVAYGNNRYVAVSDTGTSQVMYSSDGVTWVAASSTGQNAYQSITYGNGLFVAVAESGSQSIMTSPDGITWTAATSSSGGWQSITYGNGLFVAVAGTTTNQQVTHSNDGITWTTATTADSNTWQSITYGNGLFVAVATNGNSRVMTSLDGITWRPRFAAEGNSWRAITYGNGLFVAASITGTNRVMTSPDGIIWTSRLVDANSWRSVVYGGNRFVSVASDGTNRVMSATSSPWSLNQSGFQFRNDDGTESAATDIGAQNSNITWGINTPVRFRAQIDAVLASSTITPYYLQYKENSEAAWHTANLDDSFPSIVATSSGRASGNALTHTVTVPSGNIGDLIIVVFSYDGAGVSQATSSGWSKLGERSNGVIVSGAIYYKFASEDNDNDLSITTANSEESSYILYRIANAGVPTGSVTDTNGININPTLHTTSASRNYLWLVTRAGDAQVAVTVLPTGYTGLLSVTAATANGATTNTGFQYLQASATDPGIFTHTTEQSVAWTIAIPPRQTPTTQNIQLTIGASSTGANNTSYGSIAWSTPINASSSDDNRASVTLSSTTASNYLTATGTGISLPVYATITGIEAYVEKIQTAGTVGNARDNSVRLLKAGTVTGDDKAASSTNWTTTETTAKYGGSVDLWGTTWTPEDINSTNFGLAFAVAGAAAADRVANVDHIILNVYYTVPAPIQLASSSYIGTGGATSTAQLLVPSSKTAANFTGGRMADDTNPTATISVASGQYTEHEWNLVATSTAVAGMQYAIRVALGQAADLSGYVADAKWYIGTSTTASTTVLSGVAYRNQGTTTIPAGVSIIAAIGTTNPALYATTTSSNGSFTLSIDNSPGGTVWTSNYATANINEWQGVAYWDGLFVAVGRTGTNRIMTSQDGIEWTARTEPETNSWRAVTYGNGKFVAVASDGTNRVMYSSNGISWTVASSSEQNGWNAITYNSGLFVAVANSGTNRVMTSPDGITWTPRLAADTNNWDGITYGNGLFVAISTNGTSRIMTSPTGTTWTSRDAPEANTWAGITYGNGRFVAVANSGTSRVMYSDNGTSWFLASSTEASNWKSVVYANNQYVAISAANGANRVMVSQNGLTWTPYVAPLLLWSFITYGDGRFVAVANDGVNQVTTSIAQLSLDTPITLYIDNDATTTATTYLMGYTGTSTIANVPMYADTVIVINGTTSATSSVSQLSKLYFFDRSNDRDILYTGSSSASTTIHGNFITATGTTVSAQTLVLEKNFTQNGSFDHNEGTVYFAGTTTQSATGTLTGTSAFNHLTITNTSGTGSSTQAVLFGAPVTTGGTFTMMASTSARFLVSATSTFQNISWSGGGTTSPVYLRSSLTGTAWGLSVPGSQVATLYVDVRDAYNGSSTSPINCTSNCFDRGNNTNWNFTTPAPLIGLLNHSLGQVSNVFSEVDQSDVTLFRFNLTPTIESSGIAPLVVSLSGIQGIDAGELTDWKLYRDTNADGTLDAGDVAVGGSGALSYSGQLGTVTFSSSFTATTSQNYVVTADVSGIDRNDVLVLRLWPTGVTASGTTSGVLTTVSGSILGVQHTRSLSGNGGGGVSAVGGDAATGNGIISGGGGGGGSESQTIPDGDNITAHPNFSVPSSQTGGWNNGGNALLSDGVRALAPSATTHTFSNFGLVLPGANSIIGIEVKVDTRRATSSGTLAVELSWDGGATYTSAKSTPTLGVSDVVYSLGSASDLWGRSWTIGEVTDSNLRVRVTASVADIELDGIVLRIYHQAGGGGGGGGGEI